MATKTPRINPHPVNQVSYQNGHLARLRLQMDFSSDLLRLTGLGLKIILRRVGDFMFEGKHPNLHVLFFVLVHLILDYALV